MSIRHLKDGEDFGAQHFKESGFGFTGSAAAKPDITGSKNTEAMSERGVRPAARRGMAPEDGGPTEAVAHPLSGEHEGGVEYAKGGHHMHPHGHHIVRVEHNPATGHVVHHHAHGGMTIHHPDGHVSHHHHDGSMAHHAHGGAHHPGEGTMVEKMMAAKAVHQHEDQEHEGDHSHLELARGGMPRLPKGMKPAMARDHSPINRPPRPPHRNPSPRNEMPGGRMAMGVQPSAEPDETDGLGDGTPQMRGGGHHRHK